MRCVTRTKGRAISHFHVIINAQSGTAQKLGREKIEGMVAESGLRTESFDFLEAESFDARMRALLDSPHPILIGGGDGTIARAAALHMEKKKPFGILPFGTMNLLAHDLRIPVEFKEALAAYSRTRRTAIDVGVVNGRKFLCCVAWGTMPEAAKLREESRGVPKFLLMPKIAAFIFRQIDRVRRRPVRFFIDGHPHATRAGMLIVSNNLYDPEGGIAPFKRQSLRDGMLGIYKVTPYGAWEKICLMLHMTAGTWKNDHFIREYKGRMVDVDTGQRKELISIDGEPVELPGPYKFSLLEKSLPLIVPDRGV